MPVLHRLDPAAMGNDVFGTNTYHLNSAPCLLEGAHRFECEVEISRMSLGTGHYSVAIALHQTDSHGASNHAWWRNTLVLAVLSDDEAYRVGVANLPVRRTGNVVAGEGAIR